MRLRLLLGLPLFLVVAPSTASTDEPPREIAGPVEARVVKVRDGDTIEVAAYVWPQQTVQVAVRLRGIDAPELRGKCEREREAARAARDRLSELVSAGTVQLHAISGDKYFGRVLARLSTDHEADLAATLIAEGLVDPYEGGRRHDRCAALGAEGPAPAAQRRG